MKRSKQIILSAILELVEGYKKDNLSHTTYSCPLCKIYFTDKTSDNRSCGKCLNTIFEDEHSDEYGCCVRGRKFPNLDIDYDTWKERLRKNKYLAFFWQEVYDYLETLKPSEVLKPTPEIIAKIMGIARLSNDIQLNIDGKDN